MARELRKLGTTEVAASGAKRSGMATIGLFLTAVILALSAGALTGVLASYYLNNSRYSVEVSALATYRPPQVTTIYADDGETVLAEFALEKRIPIKIQDVPDKVTDALLAIEDYRFRDHIGIDPYRILGAVFKNITTGKTEGASTITQQLAKNLFLYKDQTYTRKVNEWAVALQIERLYTKDQILEMYMNYVFLGAGAYGFEAGSRTYFGKGVKDLSLEEAALLAAIPKSPEYSPTRNKEKARIRRDIVLDQMAKYFPDRYSAADVAAAKAKDIKLADTAYYQSQPKSTAWDYPVEEVRKYLEEKYTTRVAQGGLKVYTTVNIEAQKIATRSIRERLRGYDRGRAWRSDYQNILIDENDQPLTDEKDIDKMLSTFKHADWYGDEYEEGEYIKGLVMKANPGADEVGVRFGRYKAVVRPGNMGRSGRRPKDELKPGFLAEFLVKKVDRTNQVLEVELQQVPEVQAALTCINSHNGEIVAMVGGYDYHTNRFNNATQGLRQTGSAYKPFIYTAAVEDGMTPDMIVSGAPIKRGGWTPHNYDGSLSHGNVPMKIALAKSYNIAAVHLLEQVGIQAGAQMVRRFGISNPMAPSLPSALGASEASLLEMTAAYSVFPNKGVRMAPHLIRKVYSRDGSLLEQYENQSTKVTSEYVALTMVQMMRGVTAGGGTASGASAGGAQLAGKTGTVNDHTDVWFIGYTPTYVTGIWMGNPLRKESLGGGMTGGHGAVPYFNAFMIPFMKDKPRDSFPGVPPMPNDIKALAERNKREELEKLEDADLAGKKTGIVFTPGVKLPDEPGMTPADKVGGEKPGEDTKGDKPATTTDQPPVQRRPPVQPPTVKPDPPSDRPEGTRRKGKKGDG
ncbi:MAG TPA: PBP1A family penicillin-binding protein [Pyrinomonadaceae bacterium]|nr:PBP1A family penicillin-binding protein [Chloracidobacterium sp.]MBP9935341.1 PBP1A family penicillin-binding protein [Pyrinomonadaceae bacterium]MBL0241278.1 PBP1A family penicillin-binding protein [Chloracidobacterium sp.]HQX55709.1 PBP1A family penicillin-binding protein [Pyrinomonadaceae bacterium]HQY66676.1 PBP1A family penicillin-binding protein [Pyrinomonadaceae bacterium]